MTRPEQFGTSEWLSSVRVLAFQCYRQLRSLNSSAADARAAVVPILTFAYDAHDAWNEWFGASPVTKENTEP